MFPNFSKTGKGPNIWDDFTQRFPGKIYDKSNGDIAANSYELYEEDVKILKNVGVRINNSSITLNTQKRIKKSC